MNDITTKIELNSKDKKYTDNLNNTITSTMSNIFLHHILNFQEVIKQKPLICLTNKLEKFV